MAMGGGVRSARGSFSSYRCAPNLALALSYEPQRELRANLSLSPHGKQSPEPLCVVNLCGWLSGFGLRSPWFGFLLVDGISFSPLVVSNMVFGFGCSDV